jgi:hypothetical protein
MTIKSPLPGCDRIRPAGAVLMTSLSLLQVQSLGIKRLSLSDLLA